MKETVETSNIALAKTSAVLPSAYVISSQEYLSL